MNVTLKLSGLYSSLFVIRFSLIFQKKLVVGGGKQKRAMINFSEYSLLKEGFISFQSSLLLLIEPGYYSHSFSFFFQSRLEATNVNVQYVQLKETNEYPGSAPRLFQRFPPLVFYFLNVAYKTGRV